MNDLTGRRLGKLVVLRRTPDPKKKNVLWLCQCDCGSEYVTQSYYLEKGVRTHCGCEQENELKELMARFQSECPCPPAVVNGERVEYRDLTPLGFPGYCVGSDGTCWSCHPGGAKRSEVSWRKLNCTPGKNGYLTANLCPLGAKRRLTRYVHRLVLLSFVGPCPPGMETRHLDGNRRNARLDNICWGTHKENEADRIRHGRVPRGEFHCHAKLTPEQVREARRRHALGESYPHLSREMGVSEATIRDAIDRRTWTHLE